MTEPQQPDGADSPADESPAAAPEATSADAGASVDAAPSSSAGPSSDAAPSAAGRTTAQPSMFKPSYVFLGVVTIINLVADFWSKAWAHDYFDAHRVGGQRRVVVIEDVMNFIFAKNRGGAWGLLQGEDEALRRPFFLIVSVAAIVFIVSLYRKLRPDQRALKWGLPLVLGGALGNLVDRIRFGFVIDFIDVYMEIGGKVKHWPTFNVADISICVGVALMAIDMFSPRKKASNVIAASKVIDLEGVPATDPGLSPEQAAKANEQTPAPTSDVSADEAPQADVPRTESGGA